MVVRTFTPTFEVDSGRVEGAGSDTDVITVVRGIRTGSDINDSAGDGRVDLAVINIGHVNYFYFDQNTFPFQFVLSNPSLLNQHTNQIAVIRVNTLRFGSFPEIVEFDGGVGGGRGMEGGDEDAVAGSGWEEREEFEGTVFEGSVEFDGR